jgi:hypothetical protein
VETISGGQIQVVVGVLVVLLVAVAYLTTAYKRSDQQGYRLEVEPMTGVVVKNLWTGITRAFLAGSYTLRLGRDKVVETVSLKDEPSDPPIHPVTTADKVQLGVDYVIKEQRVLDNKDDVLNAALNIEYAKRTPYILARIAAGLQNVFVGLKLEDVYTAGTVNKDKLTDIEKDINEYLEREIHGPWGIRVIVEIQNLVIPERLQEVAEEVEAAILEGKATSERATAAGVDPLVAFLGEVFVDGLAALGGKLKKNGGGK